MTNMIWLAGTTLALVLTACGGRAEPEYPSPGEGAYLEQPTMVELTEADQRVNGQRVHAWTEEGGRFLIIQKNFFKGDRGNYALRGNHGQEGRSWFPGYPFDETTLPGHDGHGRRVAECLSDRPGHLVVDVPCAVAAGLFAPGNYYCITATSGGDDNWLDNHALPRESAYFSDAGDPNVPLFVDTEWNGHVLAPSRQYQADFPC